MIRENTAAKRFEFLILPALILVLLAGFMSFNSERVLAGSYVFFEFSKDNNTTLTAGGEEEWLWLHSGCTSYANPSSWNSSDETVATITAENDRRAYIRPINPGTTTISVRNKEGSKTATCEVTVIGHFEFAQSEVRVDPNTSEYMLSLKNDYADSYDYDDCVFYESSDESVAVIDDGGDDWCYVEINGPGTTIIKATDTLGKSATCTLIVGYDGLTLDTNSVTIDYKYNPYYEFNANEPYCYFHNYAICNIGPADYIQPVSGKIARVYSKNPSIATIKEVSWYDDTWVIIPKSAGTAQIVCEGEDGKTQILKVKVPGKYIASYIKYYFSCYAPYGDSIRIKGPNGSKVTVSYGGKTYKTSIKTKRTCYIKAPVRKLGTKVTCSINYGNYTYKFTGKVKGSKSTIKTKRIFKSTRKTKLTLTNVHKGDTVYVKAGSKTIKKKIKKNYKKYSYTVKLPAKKTEGKKVKITIKNKFKQTVKTKSYLIWYSTKLHKGMTKKQCKLVPGLGSPDRWYWKGRYLLWCYDRSDHGYAQLMFKNGRLWSWYY